MCCGSCGLSTARSACLRMESAGYTRTRLSFLSRYAVMMGRDCTTCAVMIFSFVNCDSYAIWCRSVGYSGMANCARESQIIGVLELHLGYFSWYFRFTEWSRLVLRQERAEYVTCLTHELRHAHNGLLAFCIQCANRRGSTTDIFCMKHTFDKVIISMIFLLEL